MWPWVAAGAVALTALLIGSALGTSGATAAAPAARRILLAGDALVLGLAPELELPPGALLEGCTWRGPGVAPLLARLRDYLAYHPTVAVLLVRGDDLATPAGVGAAAANLRELWAAVKNAGVRLYAVQLPPSGADRFDADNLGVLSLNAFIKSAEREPGGPDVVVETASLGDPERHLRLEYDAGQGRLTAAGHRALARLVAAALRGV